MSIKTLAFVLMAVFAMAAALTVPSYAQLAQNNTTGNDTIALPISAIIDSAINAHEQDIKEKIFEFKFASANNSPAVQADLIIARSDEIKKDASDDANLLNALAATNGSISDEQLAAMADETNKSMDKLDNWSKNLERHSGEVSARDVNKSYVDPVKPLMSNISNAQTIVANISHAAKVKMASEKKGTFNKNIHNKR